MDGKVLLLLCAALLGGVFYLGTHDITLGGGGGPTTRIEASSQIVNVRHAEIRRALIAEGYDENDPASYVRERDGRLVVGGPVASTEFLRPVFVDQVLANYHRPVLSETPGKVRQATEVQDCRFTPPAADARLANVFSNATELGVSFVAVRDADLSPLVHAYLDRVRAEGAPKVGGIGAITGKMNQLGSMQAVSSASVAGPFQYRAMEVAVTETATPVHLVLQTGTGRVLWNLHLADDVRISGVSLIGGDLPAIANLPKGVSVEVMDGSTLAACGVVPMQLPRASDPIFQAIENGQVPVDLARIGLGTIRDQVEAWNTWFEAQFGLRSDETRIGYDNSAILAVVGPLPQAEADRVTYHTLRRAPVVMAAADEVISKDLMDSEDKLKSIIKKRATALAGGDLASLAPPSN